jgi:hypothetical protein
LVDWRRTNAAFIQTQRGFSKQTKARTKKRLRVMVFMRLQDAGVDNSAPVRPGMDAGRANRAMDGPLFALLRPQDYSDRVMIFPRFNGHQNQTNRCPPPPEKSA